MPTPTPEPSEADEAESAAAFLEEYALRPPRAAAHNPAVDSPTWRAIQHQLRDLAKRLRLHGDHPRPGQFREADVQFLETQSSRLHRMHHWIRRDPNEDQRMAETAFMTATLLTRTAEMVRARVGAEPRKPG